mmetsp:Transcript_79987/g.226323  ORF Transcript_79987/g.226323 Transcript_79987/m.226323 type:complete len:324 (-) Transcript_79987:793-1764(-)
MAVGPVAGGSEALPASGASLLLETPRAAGLASGSSLCSARRPPLEFCKTPRIQRTTHSAELLPERGRVSLHAGIAQVVVRHLKMPELEAETGRRSEKGSGPRQLLAQELAHAPRRRSLAVLHEVAQARELREPLRAALQCRQTALVQESAKAPLAEAEHRCGPPGGFRSTCRHNLPPHSCIGSKALAARLNVRGVRGSHKSGARPLQPRCGGCQEVHVHDSQNHAVALGRQGHEATRELLAAGRERWRLAQGFIAFALAQLLQPRPADVAEAKEPRQVCGPSDKLIKGRTLGQAPAPELHGLIIAVDHVHHVDLAPQTVRIAC